MIGRFSMSAFAAAFALAAQGAQSVNVLSNPSFESLPAQAEDFEDSALGDWMLILCDMNGTRGSFALADGGNTGKCLSLTLQDVPQGDVWSCLLSQDVDNLLPARYEVIFWIKGDRTGQTAINVSAIDRNTNNILSSKNEKGFKYNSEEWLPCVTYLDLTQASASELQEVRLSIHFSESGQYLIDDASLRPVYDVPFDLSVGSEPIAKIFAFDTSIPSGFPNSWGEGNHYTPSNPIEPKQKGGASNYFMMRYTEYPELGAKPIEGERNLCVEVAQVSGNPTYEISLTTNKIASEAMTKKARLTFWARTDNEDGASHTESFCICPRFSTSSSVKVPISSKWKQYSMEYDLSKATAPGYPYFRFEFNQVNTYQIDAITFEYVDIPETSYIGSVQVDDLVEPLTPVSIYNPAGVLVGRATYGSLDQLSLPNGYYVAKWTDASGADKGKVIVIKK